MIEPTLIIQPTPEVVIVESIPLPTSLPTVNPADCSHDLTFLQDLTIPENTALTFGLTLGQQCLVENSGTCPWDFAYRLKNIGGSALGAPAEFVFYPARAGTKGTFQNLFYPPLLQGSP